MRARPTAVAAFTLSLMATAIATATAAETERSEPAAEAPELGSVIFVHPDGASAATWTAARAWIVGPDGDLQWDRLPAIAVYRGHMDDSVTATSNGGATVHAFGVKVASSAFGRMAGGDGAADIVDANGDSRSVALQAIAADIPVGVVQTGIATEPGTACFLAPHRTRYEHEAIAAKLLASGARVILGGGERWFLPEGAAGVHGEGSRTDGRDLVAEAEADGWAIVRTADELAALDPAADRVLGLFARGHTFNARPEEQLRESGTPRWVPGAPTVGDMTQAALAILGRGGRRFFLVVEEEGTDNFGNNNNAMGVLEAAERADAALGIARAFVAERPDTLLITAADSDAGGMRMIGYPVPGDREPPETVADTAPNGAPMDGIDGTGTAPFVAAPDRRGRRLPFAITWAHRDDVSGAVLVRGEGFRSGEIRGSMDNTELAKLMRRVLFGTVED